MKKLIPFSFDLILFSDLIKEDRESSDNWRNASVWGKYELEEYEKYKYIEYVYNHLKNCYKTNNLILALIDGFSSIYNTKAKINRFLNNGNTFLNLIKKCEVELSKTEYIQDYIMRADHKDLYACLSCRHLLLNKECKIIVKKLIEDLLKLFKDFLGSKNPDLLKRTYYITNFEYVMNLLGIKSISVYKSVELLVLLENCEFSNNIPYSKAMLEDLTGCKRISLEDILKYSRTIFQVKAYPSNKREQNELVLTYTFLKLCYGKYKDKKSLLNAIAPLAEKTNLNYTNFTYLKEYNYLKAILKQAIVNNISGINILLYGKPGTGKTELAKVLAKDLNCTCYTVKQNNWSGDLSNGSLDNNVERRYAFSMLSKVLEDTNNSIILYDEAEDFFVSDKLGECSKDSINNCLENNKRPVIWTTNRLDVMQESFFRRFTYCLEMSDLPHSVYCNIVKGIFKKEDVELKDTLLSTCAKNNISFGVITKALKNYKYSKTEDLDYIREDILSTVKAQSYGNFIEKKVKFNRGIDFDYRLLNTSDDLKTFCENIKCVNRLDFSLLLYGVSGGGKDYYAEYLADELGLEILKKKASDLESMYVGETEKNIAKAFKDALDNKAILLISEGDHFVSERTNHMRSWETSRTEEMLQQIEAHPYPVIITTNLIENVDKAAMRRFTYKTKFNYLTDEQIKIAWLDFFPEAPLPNNLHLSRLCPGDFNTVRKKAEFEGYMKNTSKLYEKLQEEMELKKECENNPIRL